MAYFDSKAFNEEVFQAYVDRLPKTRLTELIKSRAIRPRPDLVNAMAAQGGGNYITTSLTGNIGGAPLNYDGVTDIESENTNTFTHSRVVVGRMKSWTEQDFSYDITGGQDFMENVASQTSEYWDVVDQDTVISILKGIFSMTDTEGKKFVASHTYNVCNRTSKDGTVGCMDATTLNSAIQKACGDNKKRFSLVIMHSSVATNLENLHIVQHLTYTDENNMTREVEIGTLNGRTVLVDDSMPSIESETVKEVKGVYTLTVSTQGVAGDKLTIGGETYTFGTSTSAAKKTLAVGSSATDQATALKTVLASQYAGIFSVTASEAVVTLTELIGGMGGKPSCDKTGTVVVDVAETTAGVAQETAVTYTTYVLGEGAIEYTNCGAKKPSEMWRDPHKKGGVDELIMRQRKCFAPYGISFTKKQMEKLSPSNAELENGVNWELVHSDLSTNPEYISLKAIPIARIISRG